VTVRVLAISGSLRTESSNSSLIRAVASLASEAMDIHVYGGLGELPFFNPDLDVNPGPPAVAQFRETLKNADAVLISSPEYADGVPGVLKNALDWLVGSGELIDKPIALVNAAPRATHAYASLAETLSTMTAQIVRDASITVPVSGRLRDEHEICADPLVAQALRDALAALALAVT